MVAPKLAKVEIQPLLLSYTDAAKVLGLATQTLRNGISKGRFKGLQPCYLAGCPRRRARKERNRQKWEKLSKRAVMRSAIARVPGSKIAPKWEFLLEKVRAVKLKSKRQDAGHGAKEGGSGVDFFTRGRRRENRQSIIWFRRF